MKIKVGEFVRLARNQGINKIIDEDDDGFLILDEMIADEYGDECFEISLQDVDSEITKHSFNIIDLIEVGDIVNKSKVYEIGQSKDGHKWVHTLTGFLYYEEDLEKASILTHEQYDSNCYKVE